MNTIRLFKILSAVVTVVWFAGAPVSANEPRLVVVGGALTEIVYALGAERLLVGVDTTSQWPQAATTLPQVGYMRYLSAEGILSLAPTLLLMTQSAGPPTVIEQIREAGVTIETVSEDNTPGGVVAKIREVAERLNEPEQGERLAEQVQNDFERLEQMTSKLSRRPKVLFMLAVSRGAPIVSGVGTPADAMIRLAGGDNALTGFEGFKPVSREALIAAEPDVIVLTDLAANALGGVERIFELPGIESTPAGKKRRAVTMDTLYLIGFGPRTGQAGLDLAMHLHAVDAAESR
ncbi:MAG: hemin ABC transporter substrate-binding protein [Methylomicrobium sp.]